MAQMETHSPVVHLQEKKIIREKNTKHLGERVEQLAIVCDTSFATLQSLVEEPLLVNIHRPGPPPLELSNLQQAVQLLGVCIASAIQLNWEVVLLLYASE